MKQGYGKMEKEQRKKSNVVSIHPREVPSSRVIRRAYACVDYNAVDPSVCLSVFHCTVPSTKPIAICLRIIVMKSSVWIYLCCSLDKTACSRNLEQFFSPVRSADIIAIYEFVFVGMSLITNDIGLYLKLMDVKSIRLNFLICYAQLNAFQSLKPMTRLDNFMPVFHCNRFLV